MDARKRKEIIKATNFVIKLCLRFGSEISTAYKVGQEFASGLEREINTIEKSKLCPHGFENWDDCPDCCH